MVKPHVGIITVSDRCSAGVYVDKSGALLHELVINRLDATVTASTVSDDLTNIERELLRMSDQLEVHLILTTGGTGFSDRDVSPEATRRVIHKEAPQLALAMSLVSFQKTKFAALSRAICGIRNKTLIVNLPGSPKAVEECFLAIVDVIPHAIDLIVGEQVNVAHTHADESGKRELKQSTNSSIAHKHICPHKTNTGGVDDRNSPFPMVAVDVAVKTVIDQIKTTEQPHCLLQSPINIPEFRASIKDGYAVKANGKGLKKVIGYVAAGDPVISNDFGNDECFKINTGAAVPEFASAIVQIEDTKLVKVVNGVEIEIEILIEPSMGLDIRPIGCDLGKGKRVFKINHAFPDIVAYKSLLASVGIKANLIPHTKYPICIISTGDELATPGEPLKVGKIYDSNSTMLTALLEQHGFNPISLIVNDSFDALHNAIKEQSAKSLFIICSGGVSMGDKDHLKNVLKQLQYQIHFGRVNMKPGKPMTFASQSLPRENYVFGLPGNPVSAFVTFHLFVLPALRKYCGYNEHKLALPQIHVELMNEKIELDPRPEFARARVVSWRGKLFAEITDNQMSSRLTSIEEADVLLHLPPRTNDRDHIGAGVLLKASILKHHFISEYSE